MLRPGTDSLGAQLLRPEALRDGGMANAAAIDKLMTKAGKEGAGLSEREEMAIATVTSLQLLKYHFVDNFKLSGLGTKTDE